MIWIKREPCVSADRLAGTDNFYRVVLGRTFVGPIVLAVTWELARAWIREERAELAGPDMEQGTEALAAKA